MGETWVILDRGNDRRLESLGHGRMPSVEVLDDFAIVSPVKAGGEARVVRRRPRTGLGTRVPLMPLPFSGGFIPSGQASKIVMLGNRQGFKGIHAQVTTHGRPSQSWMLVRNPVGC